MPFCSILKNVVVSRYKESIFHLEEQLSLRDVVPVYVSRSYHATSSQLLAPKDDARARRPNPDAATARCSCGFGTACGSAHTQPNFFFLSSPQLSLLFRAITRSNGRKYWKLLVKIVDVIAVFPGKTSYAYCRLVAGGIFQNSKPNKFSRSIVLTAIARDRLIGD